MQLNECLCAVLPVSCRTRLQLHSRARCAVTVGLAFLFAPTTFDFAIDSTLEKAHQALKYELHKLLVNLSTTAFAPVTTVYCVVPAVAKTSSPPRATAWIRREW